MKQTNFQRDFVTSEGYQRMLDAAEDEQRELRLLRAGGIMPLGTPPVPGSAPAQESRAPTSPPTAPGGSSSSSRPTPLSPPLVTGLICAIKKLPSLAKNARAVSESRRRQRERGSRAAGGARISGAASDAPEAGVNGVHGEVLPRSEAFSIPGEKVGGGEAQGSDLALARRLQAEEDGGKVEAASSAVNAGGGRGVDTGRRRGSGAGGADGGDSVGLSAASAGAGATPHGGNSHGKDRLGDAYRAHEGNPNTTKAAHEGRLPLRVAVPQPPSSSALSVSTSPSGASRKWVGSESPSMDSLRGVRLSSGPRPNGGGSPKSRGYDAGGGGRAGGGERLNADTATGNAETPAATGVVEDPAAAKAAGMTYEYRNLESNAAVGAGRERRAAAYSSGGGPKLTLLTLPSGESGRSTDIFDWTSREEGVEGLDVLSSATTGDSPDWVRFSDWIRNGNSEGMPPGGGERGPSGVDFEARVSGGMEEGFSAPFDGDGDHGDSGEPGEAQPSRSWDSGGSSWSNINGASGGGSDVAEPTATSPAPPPSPPSAEEA